ncbi:MAG: hypothetical protein WDM84_01180 [Bauldia sp.]
MLTIDGSTSTVCSISSGLVSFQSVGTCTIDANQRGGPTNYMAAPQVQQSFSVGKGDQTVSFTSTAPSAAKVGGPTYAPAANSSAGVTPVTLTIDSSTSTICSISGGAVSFQAVGTCTVDANQAGNGNYNPAPQTQQSFIIGKGDQMLSFTSSAPAAEIGGPTYTPAASSTVGLTPVAFSIDGPSASVCSIAGGVVSFTAPGTCTIDANQAGDANYNAAPQAQQPVTIGKGAQAIAFMSPAPARWSTARPIRRA